MGNRIEILRQIRVDYFGVPVIDGLGVQMTVAYDAVGRRTFESYPFTTTSLGGDTFTLVFGDLGRVWTITHADSTVEQRTYSGGAIAVSDENGHTTAQHYQAFGTPRDARLTSVTDSANQAWAYQYNVAGQLTQMTPPTGPGRTWHYNGQRELDSETLPESGTTAYTYDAVGNLATKTDARNQQIAYSYDGNNRLTHVEAPGWANSLTITYDDSDNRTRAYNGVVDDYFSYDAADRLVSRTTYMPEHQFQVQYGYDDRDNVTSITYPSGRHVYYDVDAANRITHVSGDTQTFADTVTYQPSGALAGFRFGNNQCATLTTDVRQRPAHLTNGPLDLTYGYDNVGNVTSVDDARTSGGSHPYSSTFEYDALDRLTNVWGANGGDFTYDALGNRTARSWGGATTYTIDANTQRMTSSAGADYGAVSYDSVGNVTQDVRGSYGYSPFNQMLVTTSASGSQTQYAYDADGLRARASGTAGDGLRYFLHGPGGQLLAEYDDPPGDGGNGMVRESVYLGSQLIATLEGQETFGDFPYLMMNLDDPGWDATVAEPFTIRGWAVDGRAVTGSGVYVLTEWAYPFAGGDPIQLDVTYPGDGREDVGAGLGSSRFSLSGFHLTVHPGQLPPGWYQINVYALSSYTWQWDEYRWVDVYVTGEDEPGGPSVQVFDAGPGSGPDGATSDSMNPEMVATLAALRGDAMDGDIARDRLDVIAPVEPPAPPPDVTVKYYHLDAVGSVRAVTDANGGVVVQHEFAPFGENADALTNDLRRFAGKIRDGETGLDESVARYYANRLGRFTGPDPLSDGALTNPQRWNRYAYALNNPLRYLDPTGLSTERSGMDLQKAEYGSISSELSLDDWADGLNAIYARDVAAAMDAAGHQHDADLFRLQYAADVFGVMIAIAERDAPANAAAADAAFHATVNSYLAKSGLPSLGLYVTWFPTGYEGYFFNGSDAYSRLSQDPRFGSGPFGVLHDVGPDSHDFRSYRGALGAGSGSLQVTFSARTGQVHIDVDRFNPYDGGLFMLAHIFGEVIPNALGWNK